MCVQGQGRVTWPADECPFMWLSSNSRAELLPHCQREKRSARAVLLLMVGGWPRTTSRSILWARHLAEADNGVPP